MPQNSKVYDSEFSEIQEKMVGLEGKDSSTKYLQRKIYMYYRDKNIQFMSKPN